MYNFSHDIRGDDQGTACLSASGVVSTMNFVTDAHNHITLDSGVPIFSLVYPLFAYFFMLSFPLDIVVKCRYIVAL